MANKNFNKVLNSPTIMTWMSYSTKALTLFVVLPMVLKFFSEGDIVLWYLFSTIISLQSLSDFGFRQTFSRIIAYAFGGAKDIFVYKGGNNADGEINDISRPNIDLLSRIISTMKYIYIVLTIIVFVGMIIFGTWSMFKPIQQSNNINQAWIAWAIIIFISTISFYGRIYMNFLEGLNKIALVRRIESMTSLGSIITSLLVLAFAPSLLNLVIVNQFWVLLNVLRDWYLCINVDDKFYNRISASLPFDRKLFKQIWVPAWRSGISGLMSVGLTNLTGLIYAQVGNTPSVAAYLLALRIINQIKEVSMAPFYSKLPLFAMYRIKNDLTNLRKAIMRGMGLSHFVFVLGVIFVGLFSDYLLGLIGSDLKFVDQKMWVLISFAFFVHRFGAMHIQAYMSTNHIISHIADGVSGILYIVSCLLLVNYIGIYAVPIAMLIGYLGFYAWYAAKYSYRSLNIGFYDFEKKVLLTPTILFLLYILFTIIY